MAFYQSFFDYTYGEWFEWRESKVETTWQNGKHHGPCSASTKDTLTGTPQFDLQSDSDCEVAAKMQKSRYVRDVARSMVTSLKPIMYLQRYIPGMEMKPVQVIPAIRVVTLGPYAYVSQPVPSLTAKSNPSLARDCDHNQDSDPGDIIKVTVRSTDVCCPYFVDAFQIHYADGGNCKAGYDGGSAKDILLSEDKCLA